MPERVPRDQKVQVWAFGCVSIGALAYYYFKIAPFQFTRTTFLVNIDHLEELLLDCVSADFQHQVFANLLQNPCAKLCFRNSSTRSELRLALNLGKFSAANYWQAASLRHRSPLSCSLVLFHFTKTLPRLTLYLMCSPVSSSKSTCKTVFVVVC